MCPSTGFARSESSLWLGLLRIRKKLLDSIMQGCPFCLSVLCSLGGKKRKHAIASFAGYMACVLILTCNLVEATPAMPRHEWPELLNGGEVLDAKQVNNLGARQIRAVLKVEKCVGEDLPEI